MNRTERGQLTHFYVFWGNNCFMLGMIRLYMHFNPVIVRQSRLYYVPDPSTWLPLIAPAPCIYAKYQDMICWRRHSISPLKCSVKRGDYVYSLHTQFCWYAEACLPENTKDIQHQRLRSLHCSRLVLSETEAVSLQPSSRQADYRNVRQTFKAYLFSCLTRLKILNFASEIK